MRYTHVYVEKGAYPYPLTQRILSAAFAVSADQQRHAVIGHCEDILQDRIVAYAVIGEDEFVRVTDERIQDIDVVVDRIVKREDNRSRVFDSIETALSLAEGRVIVAAGEQESLYSSNYACE